MEYLADTTFLIDLWREQRRPGITTSWARTHADHRIGIPWVVAGEFLSGGILAFHEPEALKQFLDRFPIIHSNKAVISRYAEFYAVLRRNNRPIGPNDLWIAACAAGHELPLITRNVADFSVCPNLQLVDYTTS